MNCTNTDFKLVIVLSNKYRFQQIKNDYSPQSSAGHSQNKRDTQTDEWKHIVATDKNTQLKLIY